MLTDHSRDAWSEAAPADPRGKLPHGVAAVLDSVVPEIRPIVLPGQRVRDKLSAGVPLLHGEEVYVDGGAVRDAWERLLDAFALADEQIAGVATVRAALASHRLHAEHATLEALVSHPEHVREIALAADAPAGLVGQLADLAARPVLAAYARQLAPALRLAPWSRPYCPICGAWPVHGEPSAGADTVRLECGRCAAGWAASAHDSVPLDCDDAHRTAAGFRLELADREADWDGFDDD